MTEFSETETWIHFRNSSGLVLSCRRWIEEFPKITKLLEVDGTPASFPKGIVDVLSKAEIFSAESAEDNTVLVEIKTNLLRITGRGTSGYYQETKKVTYKGMAMSFRIAPKLISDLIQRHNTCILSKSKLKIESGKYSYVTVLQAKE